MFGPPSTPFAAGVQATLVTVFSLGLGYLLVDRLLGRRPIAAWIRLALSLPALVAYILLLALVHMISGGEVFVHRGAVRIVTVSVFVVLAIARLLRPTSLDRLTLGERWSLLGGLLLGVGIWGLPAFQMLPIDHTLDMPMHMGWAAQVLNGAPLPTAGVIGNVPNFYPWLYHFTSAFLTTLTPGAIPFHTQGTVHLTFVAGTFLILFGIGREFTARWLGGAVTMLLGGLTGGFGWIAAGGPMLVGNPIAGGRRMIGDLLAYRPWNASFFNLAPGYPRDLALAMLLAFLLLAGWGLQRGRLWPLVAAGAAIGSAGLAHGEAVLVGLGAAVLIPFLAPHLGRARTLAALLIPAIAVWSLWLAPLLYNASRYGIRRLAGEELGMPLVPTLLAWGITLPLGLVGAFVAGKRLRWTPGMRVLVALLLSAAGFLLLATVIRTIFGDSFAALSFRKRYWGLLHLGVALFAAVGTTWLLEHLVRRRVVFALAGVFLLVALAIPSPILGSLGAHEKFGDRREPASPLPRAPDKELLTSSLRGDPETLLNILASAPGGRGCILALPMPLGFRVFSYTGYRQVMFRRGKGPFVRWSDIDAVLPDAEARMHANEVLTGRAEAPLDEWEEQAERFDVDAVVMYETAAARYDFDDEVQQTTQPIGGETYVVVWRTGCGAPPPEGELARDMPYRLKPRT